MKIQWLALALTLFNVLFVVFMAWTGSTTAHTTAPVLRGRALELIDERGVIRARLGVKPNGGPMELDLFDRNGTIRLKLGADEGGSGLLMTDEARLPAVQIVARQSGTPEMPRTTSITLRDKNGQERVIALDRRRHAPAVCRQDSAPSPALVAS